MPPVTVSYIPTIAGFVSRTELKVCGSRSKVMRYTRTFGSVRTCDLLGHGEATSLLQYLCCDCGYPSLAEGLEDVPEPPRCLPCHLVAVIEEAGVRQWLEKVRRARVGPGQPMPGYAGLPWLVFPQPIDAQ